MKKCKQLLVLLLVCCIALSQGMTTQAAKKTTAKKTTKYTISLNKKVYTMKKGKKVTLKASLNKAAKKKGVQWSSSNKKVATVSSKGKVTAKKKGKATITARIKGTKVKVTCKIVVGTPVSKIKLNKTSIKLEEGKKFKLKATVTPKKPTNKKLIYTSSNKKIATVSSKGVITAKKAGKVKITVTAADGSGTKKICKVEVKKKTKKKVKEKVKKIEVTGVSLNAAILSLEAGQTSKLTATVAPANATDQKITWSSSNSAVAKVGADGTVTAVSAGTAVIQAKAGNGKSASCTVTVTPKVIPVTAVTLDKNSITLVPGAEERLTASAGPSNATNRTITWSSTNSSVVTVTNGTVRAVGEGTAQIKAASASGKYALCNVRVSYPSTVDSQEGLNHALQSKMVSDIVFSSDTVQKIEIPQGDYSAKTITVRAPKADVVNHGTFKKVTIEAIAENTYFENGNNTIYFNASKGHMVVGASGTAAINLSGGGQQEFHLENQGFVNGLHISAKASLKIEGTNAVPVTLAGGAADTNIEASVELNITSSARWSMRLLPGAENTKATIDNEACKPAVSGIGCIPIRISDQNELIHIIAETVAGLISQKVDITGKVQEVYLEEVKTDASPSEPSDPSQAPEYQVKMNPSAGVNIYLVPFQTDNADMEKSYQSHIAGKTADAVTDENGDYTISQRTVGNYWMIFAKEGYQTIVKSLIITSNQTNVYANDLVSLVSSQIAESGTASSISGSVINNLTGNTNGTGGLKVKLRSGSDNITGEVIASATTDENGRYTLSAQIPAGIYTLEVNDLRQNISAGQYQFNSGKETILVVPGYLSTSDYNCKVNPQMYTGTGQGQVQFTLTWGSEAMGASSDIDSHLIGPKADGNGSFHVYFSDDSYWSGGDKYADLDVDDTTWEGPEHTTIYKETPGVYRFYIHNYSGERPLASSSIRVNVTIGANTYTYYCPNQEGDLWYVCDYNSVTHTIIPKNEMTTYNGKVGDIGLSEEELNNRYLESSRESARSAAASYEESLMIYQENEAKKTYQDQLIAWKSQIEAATNYLQLNELRNTIEQAQDSLQYMSYPELSADHIYDYNFVTQNEYDEDGTKVIRKVVRANVMLLFDQLENFSANPTGTIQSLETEAVTGQSDGCRYLVHVLLENGLAYDVRVYAVAGEAKTQIANKITEIRNCMGLFESNDDLTAKAAKVAELETQTVDQIAQYDQVMEELQAILNDLSAKNWAFDVDNVSAESGLYDWYCRNEDIEDESGCRKRAVLELEHSSALTNQELIGKLKLTFDSQTVTYEILSLETGSYPAVIKAKDSESGYMKNIYVRFYSVD